jgi:hypothetical protein
VIGALARHAHALAPAPHAATGRAAKSHAFIRP